MKKPAIAVDQIPRIFVLKNPIQPYAWGSFTAIPGLLGTPSPAPQPQAELWMGAHPKASSQIQIGGRWFSLIDAIDQHPERFLGAKVAERFENRLPYLFKILAASKALSIQAHPDRETAVRGFERENDQGIALDDPRRNYKDRNHKPECICALTPFWALCGFRASEAIAERLMLLCPREMTDVVGKLKASPGERPLESFWGTLLRLEQERIKRIVAETAAKARLHCESDPVCRWIMRLYELYPDDIGVLSPAILNLVRLNPGQALYLPDGELHAYLEGTAIEVMANSDNVIRGGLTAKHVDVHELLRVLKFRERHLEVIQPVPLSDAEAVYVTPADEFRLSRIQVNEALFYESPSKRSLEILFCLGGRPVIRNDGGDQDLRIEKGQAVLVPAAVNAYRISGRAELYKTSVPV